MRARGRSECCAKKAIACYAGPVAATCMDPFCMDPLVCMCTLSAMLLFVGWLVPLGVSGTERSPARDWLHPGVPPNEWGAFEWGGVLGPGPKGGS